MKNLGLYVHIPFCKKKCGYCSFNSIENLSLIDDYTDALGREIALRANDFKDYTPDSVYFGGGTPSLLPCENFVKISKAIGDSFNIEGAEFSMEMNPESVSAGKLACFREHGANRISLGVQSLNDDTLLRIGRIHSSDTAWRAAEEIRKHFDNVSADFMLNLPGQTESDITDMLGFLKSNDIKHVSCYGLKIEDGTPMCAENVRVDEDRAAELYDFAVSAFENNGFKRYEISNFAKSGYECRHNIKYWNLSEYIGVGVSAHSYANQNRFFNGDGVAEYIDSLNCGQLYERGREKIDLKDSEFEYIMLMLRTVWGIDLKEFECRFGSDFLKKYFAQIKKYSDFFIVDGGRAALSENAYYVINSILVDFM